MSSIQIFVSYDGDHDTDLRDQLLSDSTRPGSRFEFSEHSRGGAVTGAWTASARNRIRAVDEVLVICGEYTDASSRMAAELRIVQEEEKPYVLLWGRRERMCTKPEGAKSTDVMYSWTRDILERQITETLRNSKPPVVPESCKRSRP
jgi:hypothetical protein